MINPPKHLLRFFRWFCHPEYVEDIEGDLCEKFARNVNEKGVKKARIRFLLEVLFLFRPSLIKPIGNNHYLINYSMFRHNLLITYRGFLRNKSSFLINLIGLSTGLSCVLLIYLWVSDELNIDKFHENDRQLYQVMNNYRGLGDVQTWEITPYPLAEALMEEFPEVETAAFANDFFFPKGKLSHGNRTLKATRWMTNERFFDVFSYKLLQGDKREVLASKKNIVISQEMAISLFDSVENAVGKSVEWINPFFSDIDQTYQVSGVFKNPPANSTEKFDALIHYDLFLELDPSSKEWNATAGETYLILKDGVNVDLFNQKITDYRGKKDPTMKDNELFVQKYSEKYLHGRYENGLIVGGRIEYVRYFSILSIFILLIACINFMNLSTAQASLKMKEIGVKKTMGASRNVLILQFFSESILMTVFSLSVALGLVYILLPYFNDITNKTLSLSFDPMIVMSVLGIGAITGIIAGSYPALYLSSFEPVAILKGKLRNSISEFAIRKGLVVFQFVLSVIFILGVIIVHQQLEYTQTKNMGYSRDNVISFQKPPRYQDIVAMLDEIRTIPGVEHASSMTRTIMSGGDDQGGYSWSGQKSEEDYIFKAPQIGFDVIETLGIEVVAGRSFSQDLGDAPSKLIINEAAQKLMGLENPIGTQIAKNDGYKEIIGVVEDFHYGSLHQAIQPLIFRLRNYGLTYMVKLKPGSEKSTIDQIAKVYEGFHPEETFEFTFLDEDNQRLYEAENRVAILSKYFAFLAIIISCLGLFGLVAFTAERRTKEIGIRKVLGASPWNIAKMLTTDFSKMIITAILIATPISYLIANHWLNSFEYKIQLHWWFFVGTAFIICLIAWATISFQTIKAANINPVECLRDE